METLHQDTSQRGKEKQMAVSVLKDPWLAVSILEETYEGKATSWSLIHVVA